MHALTYLRATVVDGECVSIMRIVKVDECTLAPDTYVTQVIPIANKGTLVPFRTLDGKISETFVSLGNGFFRELSLKERR